MANRKVTTNRKISSSGHTNGRGVVPPITREEIENGLVTRDQKRAVKGVFSNAEDELRKIFDEQVCLAISSMKSDDPTVPAGGPGAERIFIGCRIGSPSVFKAEILRVRALLTPPDSARAARRKVMRNAENMMLCPDFQIAVALFNLSENRFLRIVEARMNGMDDYMLDDKDMLEMRKAIGNVSLTAGLLGSG